MLPWKVLFTQTLYENKVADQLARLDIEYYLPKLKIQKQWSDRMKQQMVPAFPGYVFVKLDEKRRNEVFQAKGVLHYVRIENRDARIGEEEMSCIRRIERYPFQKNSSISVNKGEPVKIVSGIFEGYEGIIDEIKNKRVVSLHLKELSLAFKLELPINQLMLL